MIFAANAFALLGLRALYFVLKGLLDKLVYLSTGLAVILMFIGVKLVLTYFHEVFPDTVPKIETTWSLALIGVVLVVVTIASWIKTRRDPDAIAHAGRLSATPEEPAGDQASGIHRRSRLAGGAESVSDGRVRLVTPASRRACRNAAISVRSASRSSLTADCPSCACPLIRVTTAEATDAPTRPSSEIPTTMSPTATPLICGDRHVIAVADGGHGHQGPPHSIAEGFAIRALSALRVEHSEGARYVRNATAKITAVAVRPTRNRLPRLMSH